MSDKKKVFITRLLLSAGRELLEDRYEVAQGGLDATRDAILQGVAGAEAVVADGSVPVDDELLEAAGEQLEVVANYGVGFDNIDLDACAHHGVRVTNTPDVLTNATAELAVGLTLAAARDMSEAERRLRRGEWKGWDPADFLGFELSGATIGVVGMGRIGRRYAELMYGFGGEIIYTSRQVKEEAEVKLGARKVELDKLLEQADVISLHLPAAPETGNLIDAAAISLMKPTAVLVNTGRGSLVDSDALAEALENGRIGAAGLDVFENEPGVSQRLLDAPRTALTPHIGSATTRARDAMASMVAGNVIAVLEGEEPPNPVN